MVFHDGEMHGIARRKLPIPQHDLFRTLGDGPIHSQHLVHNAEQSVEGRLDCVAAVNSDVAVQDFLENLGVRNQALSLADHLFEQSPRIALVVMRSANQIHRNIGIDQNHGCAPVPYPLSISANIPSISLAG